MKYKTPETFVVGETVLCRTKGKTVDVKVLEVRGNEVKVVTIYGRPMTFRSRVSDGQHVSQFTEEFEANPDIISHNMTAPAKESFLSRALNFFA